MGTLIPLEFSQAPKTASNAEAVESPRLVYADFRQKEPRGEFEGSDPRYRLATEMLQLREAHDNSALLLLWFDFHRVLELEGQLLLTDWMRPIRGVMTREALRTVINELAQNPPQQSIPIVARNEARFWTRLGDQAMDNYGVDADTLMQQCWDKFDPADPEEVSIFNHLWTLFMLALRVFRLSMS